jgi:hypothetical protein
MAQAIKELASQASPAYQGAEGILDILLKAEVAEREYLKHSLRKAPPNG